MSQATVVAEAPANELDLGPELADAVEGAWAEDTETAYVIAPPTKSSTSCAICATPRATTFSPT